MTSYAGSRYVASREGNSFLNSAKPHARAEEYGESANIGSSLVMPSLSVAAFFLPATYAVSSRLYNLWQIAVTMISVIYILLYVTRCRITLRWLLASLFFVHYYLISSALSRADGSLPSDLFLTGASIGIVSMAEYGLAREKSKWVLAFVVGGSILCAVHYFSYLRYADVVGGMRAGFVEVRLGRATTQHWFFFTHDNGSLFFFLPVVASAWHYAVEQHSKGMFAFACLLSCLTELMYVRLWSVSAMVVTGIFLFIVVMILMKHSVRLPWGLTPRRLVVLGFAIPAALVFFGSTKTFTDIFLRFGKSLGSRTLIWSRALLAISEHPLVGNGVELGMTTTLRIGINHCHNIVLQVLYTSGGIGLVLAALYCFIGIPSKRVQVTRSDVVALTAVLMLGLAGSFDWYAYMLPQYFLLALCAHPAGEVHQHLDAGREDTHVKRLL